jgi:quercetin dioxygenase-like cupin family protein
VETRQIETSKAEFGPAVDFLWSTNDYPLEVPVQRRRADEQVRVGGPERSSLWVIATYEPHEALKLHCTDSVEYITVLAGTITMNLEDGDFGLEVGDTAMMPGLMHGWTAGPDGCTMSAVSLPTV